MLQSMDQDVVINNIEVEVAGEDTATNPVVSCGKIETALSQGTLSHYFECPNKPFTKAMKVWVRNSDTGGVGLQLEEVRVFQAQPASKLERKLRHVTTIVIV